MALIKCPECGKEVSDFAGNCPNCGFPLKQTKNNKVRIRVLATLDNTSLGGRDCSIANEKTGEILWSNKSDLDATFTVEEPTKIVITYGKEGTLSSFVKDMFELEPLYATVEGGKNYQVKSSTRSNGASAFISGLTLGLHKTKIQLFLNEVDYFDTDR